MADRLLRIFAQSDFARPKGVILGVEEQLRGNIVPGCPDLLARVDLIVDAGHELHVADFKTARCSLNDFKVDDLAPQLLLYSELVNNDNPNHSHYQEDLIMPATSNMRRFEFVGGRSDTFYEVSVQGSEVVIRFGRTGTSGQTTTKTFGDNATAEKHADKVIREKLSKGYSEVK